MIYKGLNNINTFEDKDGRGINMLHYSFDALNDALIVMIQFSREY